MEPDMWLQLRDKVSKVWQLCEGMRWGAWALVMLLLSVGSGIVVSLQYDYATPWYSSSSIELLAPYGSFFRSLHFYTSQLFFFLTVFHFIFSYKKGERYSYTEWLRLLLTLPTIILLLFTGYVLRGDSTGMSAGHIAENIMLSIPFAGDLLNSFFFALQESGLRKVYVHHIIGFDLLLLALLWKHLHIYRVQLHKQTALILVTSALCLFVTAPLDVAKPGDFYLSGPWFFLGLQELLRYLSPFIAGVLTPVLLLFALSFIYPGKNYPRKILYFIAGWLLLYLFLSGIALLRT